MEGLLAGCDCGFQVTLLSTNKIKKINDTHSNG